MDFIPSQMAHLSHEEILVWFDQIENQEWDWNLQEAFTLFLRGRVLDLIVISVDPEDYASCYDLLARLDTKRARKITDSSQPLWRDLRVLVNARWAMLTSIIDESPERVQHKLELIADENSINARRIRSDVQRIELHRLKS